LQWKARSIARTCSVKPDPAKKVKTKKEKIKCGDTPKQKNKNTIIGNTKHRIHSRRKSKKHYLYHRRHHRERRVSEGLIDVVMSNDGKKMSGTFSGTAASCKGTVIVEKK